MMKLRNTTTLSCVRVFVRLIRACVRVAVHREARALSQTPRFARIQPNAKRDVHRVGV